MRRPAKPGEPHSTLRPGPERAFLVGIEHRARRVEKGRTTAPDDAAGISSREPGAVPPTARQAKQALQAKQNVGEHLVPFTAEESLHELRELAIGAGAEIAGEFLQRRDRPDPATLIAMQTQLAIQLASTSIANGTPVAVATNVMPKTGFFDQVVPSLILLTLALVAVIFLARRLRKAPSK